MNRIILSTSPIIRQYRGYEPLFMFYPEGIRGLVRDTALLCRGWPYEGYNNWVRHGQHLMADGLLDSVLQLYNSSFDIRYRENTYTRLHPSHQVEMIVEQIDFDVTELFKGFFHTQIFELCKSRTQWVGNDLLIYMERLDDITNADQYHFASTRPSERAQSVSARK